MGYSGLSAALGDITLLLFGLCQPLDISAGALGCLMGVSAIRADNGRKEVLRGGEGHRKYLTFWC